MVTSADCGRIFMRLTSQQPRIKKRATSLGGLEGIEGFFRQVYVISPFYFFVSLVGGVFGLCWRE
jgi:hypothetical protein